jgi:hypothetical protein
VPVETEEQLAIRRIEVQGIIDRAALREEALTKLYARQLVNALGIEEDRMQKGAAKAKVFNTIAADFDFDTKFEDFLAALQEMELDPLREVQHRMKAQATAKQEKIRNRRSRR